MDQHFMKILQNAWKYLFVVLYFILYAIHVMSACILKVIFTFMKKYVKKNVNIFYHKCIQKNTKEELKFST